MSTRRAPSGEESSIYAVAGDVRARRTTRDKRRGVAQKRRGGAANEKAAPTPAGPTADSLLQMALSVADLECG